MKNYCLDETQCDSYSNMALGMDCSVGVCVEIVCEVWFFNINIISYYNNLNSFLPSCIDGIGPLPFL